MTSAASNALMLVEHFGAAVVPVYGITSSGACLCRYGADCDSAGKHPVRGPYNSTINPGSIRKADPSRNWSAAMGYPFVGLDDDTDDGSGIKAVEAEIGAALPATPTIRTGGGHQTRIFRTPVSMAKLVPLLKTEHGNVDFLGEGIVAVLPGSRSGRGEYQWLPRLSPISIGFADLPAAVTEMVNSKRLRGDEPQNTPAVTTEQGTGGAVTTENSCGNCDNNHSDVERLIRRCIPDNFGLRWHCLFRLARGLRGLPEYANASQEQLEPVLLEWHHRSMRCIRTKDISTNRRDLWSGYLRVQFPGGIAGKLAAMVDPRFGSEPLPIRLDRLCRALQDANGDRPFFLACRSGAEVLGVSHPMIVRLLKEMTTSGTLKLVERGQRRRASEYRYLGGGQ
jgi:Bifunctional DNA primase/polymerase, N-terminal